LPSIAFDAAKIDDLFADLDRCHLPGAAVGIAIHGRPVYRKGFGLASVELPVVLTPSTRMRIGSISKHFAALAYLLLCEEGKAGLDEPIGKWLPELHSAARAATARQLMGHTSGLRDALDIVWQFGGAGRAVSSGEVLSLYEGCDEEALKRRAAGEPDGEAFRGRAAGDLHDEALKGRAAGGPDGQDVGRRAAGDVNAEAGSTWSYNNGGYVMLSVAIERIAGQPLEQVLRERVFEPVGMNDTLLRRFDTDFVPNSATLHMTTREPSAGRHHRDVEFQKSYLGTALTGEGGIASTVDDMLRWLSHMSAPHVGNAATWAAIKTPQRLANGASTGYGLGLIAGRYRGVETTSHEGGVMGGNADMLKVPAAGLDVVVLANRHDLSSSQLVNRILDACLPGLDAVEESHAYPMATGVFRSARTGRVIQLFARNELQFVLIDGVEMSMCSDAQGALRPLSAARNAGLSIALAGERVAPKSLRLIAFGDVDELVRQPSLERSPIASIVGCYRSNSTGTEATIDANHLMRTMGRFGSANFALECLAENIWRAKSLSAMPWGGVLTFNRSGHQFVWSTFRTRELIFQRDG
jgi:CubicO group peptidase (beta-lactamase class C family)